MLNLHRNLEFFIKSDEKRFALAEILESTGSTPLKVGAKMAVLKDGRTCGTVGGGKLEAAVIEKSLNLMNSQSRAETVYFDLSKRDDSGLGMICGGDTSLGIIILERAEAVALEKKVAACMRAKKPAFLLFDFADSFIFFGSAAEFSAEIGKRGNPEPESFAGTVADRKFVLDGRTFIEYSSYPDTVHIFGGGHVSFYLSKITAMLGFETAIYDDREEFANMARFPHASTAKVIDFTHFTRADIGFRPSDYYVIMTRGHGSDRQVLKKIIEFGAEKYMGMIGSRSKVRDTKNALEAEGVPRDALDRLKSPIGLAIGALSAEEIAVSIAAEIISVRRKKEL